MSDNVKLTYKRVGEKYVGSISYQTVEGTALHLMEDAFPDGIGFAEMMTKAHGFLVKLPDAGLIIQRTDRAGLLHAQLEPKLLELLRTDPVSYIKANTVPDRVIDLTGGKRTSKLAERQEVPRTGGLVHGLDTLASAFGEALYARSKKVGSRFLYEHPATGRWADLNTIEHWLGSHDTEVQGVDDKRAWLLISTERLLKTNAERFYYPRAWNEYGSWITKEQLRTKLEQFRKDKANDR